MNPSSLANQTFTVNGQIRPEKIVNSVEKVKKAEEKEISGKPIIQKIKILNRNIPEEEQLDDAKRLYWARIILNCILTGKPSENMNIGDVTERNLKEIFGWLKLHYGVDTRGITGGKDHQAPGVF